MIKEIIDADITWDNKTPRSVKFDDVYFDCHNGFAESKYVFLDSNFISTSNIENVCDLAIGETGFGTGLNFFLTWSFFDQHLPNAKLHFVSTEKHPISKTELAQIYTTWPDITKYTGNFLKQYPENPRENLDIILSEQVRISLLLGDAAESFAKQKLNIDAWYLDGFAPSKNPDMWSPELFEQIARLSHPGTTFSTFTAAGMVRRGLQDVGFEVRKQKGFGRKREMLVGTFKEHKKPIPILKPWFEIPASEKPEAVTVIGGGLAGCSTARALADRGIKVTLIEKAPELASGGSGNRQGALYAKLPVAPTKQGELHTTGYLYTLNRLKQWDPEQSFWQACGVAQLATNEKEQKRQAQLILENHYPEELVTHKSADELSEIAGIEIQHSGLFFPDAGWVSPRDFCQKLVDHENINIITAEITKLSRVDDTWQLSAPHQDDISASHIVLCNAELASQFEQTEHLPLKTIRGQVSITPKEAELPELKTVICGAGYISPAQAGQYCFGATFDLKGKTLNVTDADHNYNLKTLKSVLPSLHDAITESKEPLNGRTAFRCSTPDYMPIVGPAPEADAFIETFAPLRKDRKWHFDNAQASHHPNLYINTGHGSKGLITCPISAELLAAMICDEPLPLPKDLIDTINPGRFIIKNLIKQAI